VQNFII